MMPVPWLAIRWIVVDVLLAARKMSKGIGYMVLLEAIGCIDTCRLDGCPLGWGVSPENYDRL